MRQNKEIFDKYADKLQSAMKREGLMNKEVAEIFDVPTYYMSNMNKHPEKVPLSFMEKVRAWAILDIPLRGYKLPTPEELLEPVPAEVSEAAKEQAQTPAPPVPETPPLTKEEKKAQKAARIRELYERSKPPRKDPKPGKGSSPDQESQPGQPDTIVISREGDKVDLSKINLRTGTTIFTAEVTDNEIIIRFPLVRMERATK